MFQHNEVITKHDNAIPMMIYKADVFVGSIIADEVIMGSFDQIIFLQAGKMVACLPAKYVTFHNGVELLSTEVA